MNEETMEVPVQKRRGRPRKEAEPVKPSIELADDEPDAVEQPPKRMMINVTKVIRDVNGVEWHKKRRWKELTPAVCQVEECAFDFLEENKLPKWDELTKQEQDLVMRGMAAHAQTHEHQRARIVSSGEYEEIQKEGWPPPPNRAAEVAAKLKNVR